MNKKVKWGLVALLIAGVGGFGFYQLMPKENQELSEVDAMPKTPKKKSLDVYARVIEPLLLTD
jgi:membrane fusion protein (multidrug efflux system)